MISSTRTVSSLSTSRTFLSCDSCATGDKTFGCPSPLPLIHSCPLSPSNACYIIMDCEKLDFCTNYLDIDDLSVRHCGELVALYPLSFSRSSAFPTVLNDSRVIKSAPCSFW